MSCGEIFEFVWQHELRKEWHTFTADPTCMLNKALQENQKSVMIRSRIPKKKTFNVDFEKMVMKDQVTKYEQRVRCLAYNSELFVWLWKDEYGEWQCFKPYLCFLLEVAFHQKEKKLIYHDNANYEINLETFEQVNEDNKSTCSVKREVIDIKIKSEAMEDICKQNEVLLIQACSKGPPSAKRIRIDSYTQDTSTNIILPSNSFNPLNCAEPESLSLNSTNIPVDDECPKSKDFHIYCENSVIYSATLNQTNFQNNNNKFYMIQLLESNQAKQYAVWRRWGRVGYKGQTDFSNYRSDLLQAKASFDDKFYAKTKNHWSDHINFVHHKGKYDLLKMDLNPVQKSLVKETKPGVESKLVSQLQSLLELVCDKKGMEEVMKEMSYDSKRSPLGKLTLRQVQDGYIALNKVATCIASGKNITSLLNACNEFYTKIPHDFGMKNPPLIQTQDQVNEKLRMLEALSNITVAMDVLNSGSDIEEHPLDKYYNSLNCKLEPVSPSDSEYLEIKNRLKETHGPTHNNYELEIIDVFRSCKEKEHASFMHSENSLLLWHGSRTTNWLGILKEGLRIAPPEAPSSGYMFGKGIYFADVCSKSANYCFASKKKNEGVLLICEVSIGKQFTLNEADSYLPVGLPDDCNSVLGKGRISPSEFKIGSLSSEAKAPYGPLIEDNSYQGSLIYNEYIVYNVQQVKMKYLVRVKFNFK